MASDSAHLGIPAQKDHVKISVVIAEISFRSFGTGHAISWFALNETCDSCIAYLIHESWVFLLAAGVF
jgi:hypothetical protein